LEAALPAQAAGSILNTFSFFCYNAFILKIPEIFWKFFLGKQRFSLGKKVHMVCTVCMGVPRSDEKSLQKSALLLVRETATPPCRPCNHAVPPRVGRKRSGKEEPPGSILLAAPLEPYSSI